jgi:hypothetical protein
MFSLPVTKSGFIGGDFACRFFLGLNGNGSFSPSDAKKLPCLPVAFVRATQRQSLSCITGIAGYDNCLKNKFKRFLRCFNNQLDRILSG